MTPRLLLALAIASLTSACARFGFEGPRVDAIADSGGPEAGGQDAGCDWQTPQMLSIGGTSTASFFGGPGPTSDRLTLYFSMQPSGGNEQIYVATRADVLTSTFGTATQLTTIASPGSEGSPFPSTDERTLFYFSDAGGGTNARQLYSATRSSTGATFGSAAPLANVNDPSGLSQGPRTTVDGLTLVWSSTRTGSMSEDLYLGTRTSTMDPFVFVRRIDELATSGRDQGGSFADGGLTLYFASQRTGTMGGLDLWSAARPDGTSSFGVPTNLANVNSVDDEFDGVITADGLEIFFASSRGGKTRLWHSLRQCVP